MPNNRYSNSNHSKFNDSSVIDLDNVDDRLISKRDTFDESSALDLDNIDDRLYTTKDTFNKSSILNLSNVDDRLLISKGNLNSSSVLDLENIDDRLVTGLGSSRVKKSTSKSQKASSSADKSLRILDDAYQRILKLIDMKTKVLQDMNNDSIAQNISDIQPPLDLASMSSELSFHVDAAHSKRHKDTNSNIRSGSERSKKSKKKVELGKRLESYIDFEQLHESREKNDLIDLSIGKALENSMHELIEDIPHLTLVDTSLMTDSIALNEDDKIIIIKKPILYDQKMHITLFDSDELEAHPKDTSILDDSMHKKSHRFSFRQLFSPSSAKEENQKVLQKDKATQTDDVKVISLNDDEANKAPKIVSRIPVKGLKPLPKPAIPVSKPTSSAPLNKKKQVSVKKPIARKVTKK